MSPLSKYFLSFLAAVPFLAGFPVEAGESPMRVACLGDSITSGAKVNAAAESYPVKLQALLGADFEVKNFGRAGATMMRIGKPNAFQELPPTAAFAPQIVIVDFGINDTRGGDVNYWGHVDEFDTDTKALLTQLLDLPTKPAVLLCLPTANQADLPGMPDERKQSVAERLPRLVEVRQRLQKLAKDLANSRLSVIDLDAVTANRPELFNVDGVHLKAEGYNLLAETLAPHVRDAAATAPK